MHKTKILLIIIFSLIAGILIGGFVFSQTQKRSFLALHDCQDRCLQANEFMGLLGSIGVQKFPGALPSVMKETDMSIAFKHPKPVADIHIVVVPKKDIKNIGELNEEDKRYVADAYAVMAEIIKEQNLYKYKIITNGPGYQEVTYLHFHIIADVQ
jgi:histidine triad (HIT) family protein